MKKLLSLVLTAVISVGMCGCKRDITEPLTTAEQTLVDEWSGMEEDLNSYNISSIEDTIEELDNQVELLEEEQDHFKKDDIEYKAIEELVDVFDTSNDVLEIIVNFIKNPMSALVMGDAINQQMENYGIEIQDSISEYKKYKEKLGIVTNVDLREVGNQENNTKDITKEESNDKDKKTNKEKSKSQSSITQNISNKTNQSNNSSENKNSNNNNSSNNNKNEGYYVTCPDCGRQIYTINGDWDCDCYLDYQYEDNDNSDTTDDDSNIDYDNNEDSGYDQETYDNSDNEQITDESEDYE